MRQPRRQLAARRKTVGFTQESLAYRLGVDRSTIARWESGETEPQPWLRRKLAQALALSLDDVAGLLTRQSAEPVAGDSTGTTVSGATLHDPSRLIMSADADQIEARRRALHDVLADGRVSAASLDDWELTVVRYGAAAKDRVPSQLLNDLTTDFGELQPLLARCRSATGLRRLTRVAAQLSGLMCLTLIKLDA